MAGKEGNPVVESSLRGAVIVLNVNILDIITITCVWYNQYTSQRYSSPRTHPIETRKKIIDKC